MIPLLRHNAIFFALLALPQGVAAQTQDAATTPPVSSAAGPAAQDVTTMEAVKVVAPRPPPETVDLYRNRNPIQVDSTRFNRHWDEAPSLEEVGKRGGYVQLGINYAIGKVGEAVTRTPGWKAQVQAATARPPPAFDEQQLRRATQACQAERQTCE
jgi:hypothetical protein